MADEEITMEKLQSILDAAYFETTMDDDGDIYIEKGLEFPIFFNIMPEAKMIRLFTYINFKDGENVDQDKANALANRINKQYMPNSVYNTDGRLCSSAYMTFDGGFSDKSFIEMARRAAGSFKAAVNAEDTDDLIA